MLCHLSFCIVSSLYLLWLFADILKAVCDVHVADTPDADEGKLPEASAADEWDITSPPIEQRSGSADASATVTSPEKKKKPRLRGTGN